MRIIHGTGIRGLAGIPQKRGRIIRPLLGVDRDYILSYCASKEVPFSEDPSNNDRRYFRNRIRLDLLPHLSSSYHPAIADNIVRLAQNAQSVVSMIRVDTDPIIATDLSKTSPNQWILNTRQIGLLDDTSIVILFGDLFANELSCDMDFTHTHYEQLVRLVRDTGASGRMLTLPALTVKREYEDLVITRTVQDAACGVSSDDCTTLSLPGTTTTADAEIKTEILDRSSLDDMSIESSPSHACLDHAALTPPLTVRRPVPGDRMQPFGMTGTKKLSDIFIDKKIPARTRATSLVISDANGILWLVGVTVAERSRVGSGTREVVRIHVEKK
jgi:tRNA(Ile)-lysidine synthase